jgi:sec-independent protein translocase protein TatA
VDFFNPVHIMLLLLIVLLVFGAKRLPEIGRSLGTGLREFKSSVTGEHPQQPTLTAAQPQAQPQQQQAPAQQAPAQQAPTPPPPA